MHDGIVGPDGNVVTHTGNGTPAHTGHVIRTVLDCNQVLDFSRSSIPQIHTLRERDGENVVFSPANQVEVVVVDNVGRVQNTEWSAGNLAEYFLWRRTVGGRVEVGLAEFHGPSVVIERIFRKRRPAAVWGGRGSVVEPPKAKQTRGFAFR
jgi:hypothetical protein